MTLHIICFDQPFPPTYGGAVDVFYKIRALYNAGIHLILHIFLYGSRKPQPEIERYADHIFYYKRKTGIISNFSFMPYIVKSRESDDLLHKLCCDNYPILFEGLHTCFYLDHPALKKRIKMVRLHNIEHKFYRELASATPWSIKKIFLMLESWKLKKYEPHLEYADRLLPISIEDNKYYKELFSDKEVNLLNCFFNDSPNWLSDFDNESRIISEPYILYHGNLAVAENEKVARYIVDKIRPKLAENIHIVIAGREPSHSLQKKLNSYSNVKLVVNPTMRTLDNIIHFATVNLMLTFQSTGVKLKLLNTLVISNGYCIANDAMLYGTCLSELCIVANTDYEISNSVNKYIMRNPPKDILQERLDFIHKFKYNDITTIIS